MDDTVRNLIRCGNSVERIDLYIRLDFRTSALEREISVLINRLYKTKLETDKACLDGLVAAALEHRGNASRSQLLNWVENLFIV